MLKTITFDIRPLKCEPNAIFSRKGLFGILSPRNIFLDFEESSIQRNFFNLKLVSIDFLAISFDIGPLKCEPKASFLRIQPFQAFCIFFDFFCFEKLYFFQWTTVPYQFPQDIFECLTLIWFCQTTFCLISKVTPTNIKITINCQEKIWMKMRKIKKKKLRKNFNNFVYQIFNF